MMVAMIRLRLQRLVLWQLDVSKEYLDVFIYSS
jgi:hypothetical protein